MAYLNSNNYVVMNDWDADPDAGASGAAIYGLLPHSLIRITIESGQASPSVRVALFTDYSWEYYSEVYIEGIGEFVELTLSPGENIVLSEDSNNTVQVSIVYMTEEAPVSIYSQPSIVPAAVSSQLDVTGEERIHIAPYADVAVPNPPDPPQVCATLVFQDSADNNDSSNNTFLLTELVGVPEGFGTPSELLLDFGPEWGPSVYEYYAPEGRYYRIDGSFIYSNTTVSGVGTISVVGGGYSNCINWTVLGAGDVG